jgi:hypothetical protein
MNRIIIVCMTLACCFGLANSTSLSKAHSQDVKVSYYNHWPACDYGSRNIRVTITPFPTRLKKSKEFTFVHANGGNYGSPGKTTSCDVTLEAGAAEAVGELYIPINGNGYGLTSIFLDTDGNLQPNRNDLAASNEYDQNYFVASTTPKVLFVSSSIIFEPPTIEYVVDAKGKTFNQPTPTLDYTVKGSFPAVGEAQSIFDEFAAQNPYSGNRAMLNLEGLSSELVYGCIPANLPSKWQGLAGISHMFISFEDFQLMESSLPARKLAIERWVAAGGHLFVFNCGEKFEQLENVQSIISPESTPGERKRIGLKIPGDSVVGLKQTVVVSFDQNGYFNSWNDPDLNETGVIDVDSLSTKKSFEWNDASLKKAVESSAPFCSFSVARGEVICVRKDGAKWKKKDWRIAFNGSFFLGSGITKTTGYNTAQELPQYAIRSLGKPPAVAFRVLILFFIILTGPVSYFFLKRIAKLHLLFVWVPLISAIFCFSLLSYAVLMDGLGIQGRRVTVTELDQIADKRATSMHYTIYSGLAPQAYQFQPTAFGEASIKSRSPRMVVNWNQNSSASSQTLRGAEIRPRTSHQIFAFDSNETKIGLEIRERKNEKGVTEASVTNLFADKILGAIIRTESGYFKIDNVYAGKTVVAESITWAESIAFQKALTREILGGNIKNLRPSSDQNANMYSEPRVDSNSDRLVSTKSDVLKLANGYRGMEDLDRGTYVVFLQEFSETIDPIENIEMESNLNVVFGKW